MTLASRLVDVVSAIGADIKSLRARLAAVEGGAGGVDSPVSAINVATSLIRTQKVMAQMALRGQL